MAIFIKFEDFAYVKKLVVEKYAKFDKYAKPKIFMPTISKNAKFQKFGIKICQLATLLVSAVNSFEQIGGFCNPNPVQNFH